MASLDAHHDCWLTELKAAVLTYFTTEHMLAGQIARCSCKPGETRRASSVQHL